jgi:hypothetical protein
MKSHVRNRERWQPAFLRAVTVAFVVIVVVMSSAPAWAQSESSSTIHGTVTDESGAALPGVTVTLTSPVLQVGKETTVTGPDGAYRLGDLPVGTYKIAFELSGFKTFVRDGLRMPLGFVARVDVTMAVGGIEESVTVSGASPVVDQTTTSTSVNITRETLDAVPAGRGYQQLFAMTPGVTTAGAPDVGDSSMATRNDIQNYGVTATAKMNVEGMNISVGPSSGVYFTNDVFEEIQIKTSGNDAEVSTPGISMVSVLKSGSNQFHGSYSGSAQRPELQSSNFTPRLRAQGISETPPLRYYYDAAGDLGGRIIRDKLWFYAAMSKQKRVSGILGFVSGPDSNGCYLCPGAPPAYYENNLTTKAVKISYQATQNNRLIGVWEPMLKYQPERDADRFRPLESTTDYSNPGGVYKGELQSTITTRIVANVVAGYGGNTPDYSAARSKFNHVVPGNPSRFDKETALHTGAGDHNSLGHSDRWQADGGVTFFPETFLGGHHELKAGSTLYWERDATGKEHIASGDYMLIYDKVGGVSHQPVEIDIYNSPVDPTNMATHYGGYLKDTWRITGSLTANLGVRFEYQHAYLPKQTRAASPEFPTLFPAATFPALNVQTWKSTVPRFGLAWSLGPRTVIKGSVGRYNAGLPSSYASSYNQNAQVTVNYKWSDPHHTGDYAPGDVNLDLNSPDFNKISGANNVINPNLRQPMTTEATAGFERELMKNLGFRALYVFKNFADQYTTTNILRPRSAYNIPLTRRVPEPNGTLTGADTKTVTIWDYGPAYHGANFVANERMNSSRTDWYQSAELTLTKRAADRWFGMASFWATKHHHWLSLIPDNPNSDYFPLDQSWSWAFNMSGSYRLLWDVQVGAYLQTKNGFQGQRTYSFRAADPDGGPSLKEQTSGVTVNLDPFGKEHGPAIRILDLRTSKQFSLGSGRRFEVDFDVFNLLNSSAPTTITYVTGPTFGWYGVSGTSVNAAEGGILPARVARIGGKYSF